MCKPGRGRLAAALLLAVLVVPSLARAQLVDEESVGRLTIGLGIGVMVPNMQDVNDNAEIVSRFLARDEIRGLDPIHEGLVTHLDLRYRLSAMVADEYATAGFTAVVQDNIYGEDVATWLERVRSRPRHLVAGT